MDSTGAADEDSAAEMAAAAGSVSVLCFTGLESLDRVWGLKWQAVEAAVALEMLRRRRSLLQAGSRRLSQV